MENEQNGVDTDSGQSDPALLDKLTYLWQEYEYRHTLVWNLIFRFTAAIVLVSIVPYVQIALVRTIPEVVLLAPLIAMFLALFSIPVMKKELELLSRVRNIYRKWQNKLERNMHPNEPSTFAKRVIRYFYILVALSAANVIVTLYLVLTGTFAGPSIMTPPCCP